MKDIFYTLALTLGVCLVILAISIMSLGYAWHLIKPTVERTELRLLGDSNESN